jgi:LCP family protein required for cell wall assembly
MVATPTLETQATRRVATRTPAPSGTPAPTATDVVISPTPAPTIPVPTEQIRILLLGSDIREDNSFRTDVILLLIINPAKGTASVVSFPRDLYVYLPYGEFARINTVQYHGFKFMADTMESNFGVRPQYYMMTNLDGFVKIIDGLGGIDVNVGEPLTDKCDLPSSDAQGNCSVAPGSVRMDGQFALWYVRSRYSTDDFERQRRSQEVLQGVFARLLTLDALTRAPDIFHQFSSSVETNLDLRTILSLASVAPRLTQSGSVRRFVLTPRDAFGMTADQGASVLYPNLPAIQAIIREAVGER